MPNSPRTFSERVNNLQLRPAMPTFFKDSIDEALFDNPIIIGSHPTHVINASTLETLTPKVNPFTRGPLELIDPKLTLDKAVDLAEDLKKKITQLNDKIKKIENDITDNQPRSAKSETSYFSSIYGMIYPNNNNIASPTSELDEKKASLAEHIKSLDGLEFTIEKLRHIESLKFTMNFYIGTYEQIEELKERLRKSIINTAQKELTIENLNLYDDGQINNRADIEEALSEVLKNSYSTYKEQIQKTVHEWQAANTTIMKLASHIANQSFETKSEIESEILRCCVIVYLWHLAIEQYQLNSLDRIDGASEYDHIEGYFHERLRELYQHMEKNNDRRSTLSSVHVNIQKLMERHLPRTQLLENRNPINKTSSLTTKQRRILTLESILAGIQQKVIEAKLPDWLVGHFTRYGKWMHHNSTPAAEAPTPHSPLKGARELFSLFRVLNPTNMNRKTTSPFDQPAMRNTTSSMK